MRGNGSWSFSPTLSPDAWARAVYRAINIAAVRRRAQPGRRGPAAEVDLQGPGGQRDHVAADPGAVREDRPAGHRRRSPVSINHGIDVDRGGGRRARRSDRRAGHRDRPARRGQRRVRNAGADPDGTDRRRAATASASTGLDDRHDHPGQRQGAAAAQRRQERDLRRRRRSVRHDGALARSPRRPLAEGRLRLVSNIATQSVPMPRKYTAVGLSRGAGAGRVPDIPHGGADRHHAAWSTAGGSTTSAAGSYIDFLHSFDNGATWIASLPSQPTSASRTTSSTTRPSRTFRRACRTVLFKFLIHNTNPDAGRASGLYSVRMEVDHRPATPRRRRRST